MRGRDDDRVRAQAARLRAAHRRAHAVRLRLVARGEHDARPDDHRPAAQPRVVALLDRRVERVEVGVQDRRLVDTNICSHMAARFRQADSAAASARASRRSSPSRSAQAANAGVGPSKRRSAPPRRARSPSRSVARSLKSSARSRLAPEHLGREGLDRAVLVHEPGGRDLADPGDARIAVGRVADEREQVGDQRRIDPELLAHPVGVAHRPAAAIDLHDPVALDALGQVLVGRPDAHLLDLGRRRRRCARRRRARRRPRARPSATR